MGFRNMNHIVLQASGKPPIEVSELPEDLRGVFQVLENLPWGFFQSSGKFPMGTFPGFQRNFP